MGWHTLPRSGVYRDFSVTFAAELERRHATRCDVDPNRPFAEGEDVRSVVASVTELTREAIDACYAAIDPHDVDRVARTVRAAGHNWHVHHATERDGQMLICVYGRGWYQEWGKPARELNPETWSTSPPTSSTGTARPRTAGSSTSRSR